ncbi:type VI immunity family protein [Hyalangium rubrum]|uniref:DUF3396 domain-containing protein n=1 Tax=Hyalangium rubrum TaxID=3103134 RepID=A0ABU5H1W5_9BACT|nr:type VI immunity family protein [Hyalangium sp. s54d21]MDY7227450.1 DUF3396 domain-containing protein [Hyalangium sp. s54d21]
MSERFPVFRLMSKGDRMVARDGLVLCFFMRRPHGEIAPALWRALQTYRRAILPQSLNWYGAEDGDTLPLDDKGWEHIRWKLLERPWGDAWNVDLEEDCSEIGGYHFEYRGWRLDAPSFERDEDSSCGVSFTFPTEYLLGHGPAHLRTVALELAHELPFSFGYASLAVISPHGMWYAARHELIGLLNRYMGLDFYHLDSTCSVIGTRARGAYWLTFLGQPLLSQLGGIEALRHKLPFQDITFHPLEGERLLLTLGQWPDAIDIQSSRKLDVAHYRALAHLLEPLLYEERSGWVSLDKDNMRRWLRRLCQ